MTDTDFRLDDFGSMMLLTPISEAASNWLSENIGDDAIYLGLSLAIDYRYADEIVAALVDDGLDIEA